MAYNTQPWHISHRADTAAARLADCHYNRQKIGTPQFAPTGSCAVFVTGCGRAFWITSAPFAEWVKHAWAGTWVCSAFRSEGAGKASKLIIAAVAASLSHLWRITRTGNGHLYRSEEGQTYHGSW